MNKIYLRSFFVALTIALTPASVSAPTSTCKDAFAVDLNKDTAIAYPIQETQSWSTNEWGCYGDNNDPTFQNLLKRNPDLRRYDTESIQAENLELTVTACAENPDQVPTKLTKDNANQVTCNTEPYPFNLMIPNLCKDAFAVDRYNRTAIAYPIQETRSWSTDELGCYGDKNDRTFQNLLKRNQDLDRYDTESIQAENLQLTVKACAETPDQDPTSLTKDNVYQVACNTKAYPSNLVTPGSTIDFEKIDQILLRIKEGNVSWASLQAELPFLKGISEKDKKDIQTFSKAAKQRWNQAIKDADQLYDDNGGEQGAMDLMKVQKNLSEYANYVQKISNVLTSKNKNTLSN
jgi:hypothetical protein